MSLLRRFRTRVVPALIITLLAGPAWAFDLNGAWATDPGLCSKVFKKTGNLVTLTPTSDLYGGGFIFDGDHVRGKIVNCRIDSMKQDGSTIHLNVACTTEIATEQIQFDLKVVNDNTVSKTFPETNIGINYYRCTL
jgi:hypothetical protein